MMQQHQQKTGTPMVNPAMAPMRPMMQTPVAQQQLNETTLPMPKGPMQTMGFGGGVDKIQRRRGDGNLV